MTDLDDLLLWMALPPVVMGTPMTDTLISRQNLVESAFSSVGVQIGKRLELPPNPGAAWGKHLGFRKGILKEPVATRLQAPEGSTDNRVPMGASPSRHLGPTFTVAENHLKLGDAESPSLQQRSLDVPGSQGAATHRNFNGVPMALSNACELFPNNVVAKLMGRHTLAWFDPAGAERAPAQARS